MDQQNYYRVSIKGIVIDENGRFLLSKEDDGEWELLGVGLDHGEDPKTCLTREVYEETGLKVTRISETPLYFVTSPRRHHDTYAANVIYQIELENLNFKPSDECVELRFCNLEEAQALPLFPNMKQLLKINDEKYRAF